MESHDENILKTIYNVKTRFCHFLNLPIFFNSDESYFEHKYVKVN